MELTVYLPGEIHTNWRKEIIQKCEVLGLPIEFLSPVTNHELSDDVGVVLKQKLSGVNIDVIIHNAGGVVGTGFRDHQGSIFTSKLIKILLSKKVCDDNWFSNTVLN